MITKNLLFIFRRFSNQKVNTFLHLTGLTLGLGVCLIIALFIEHEMSYDQYHQYANRIYRVTSVWSESGEEDKGYGNVVPLANALRESIPEFEYVVKVYPRKEETIKINEYKQFKQNNILITEPDFFNIFDVEVLEGDGHSALKKPYQALLTPSAAKKFFGKEYPIGQTFQYKGQHTITVAGLIEEPSNNTNLPASVILSWHDDPDFIGFPIDSWFFTTDVSTYVLLNEKHQPDQVAASLKPVFDQNTNVDPEEIERLDGHLQPLTRIHLEPEWGGGSLVKAINPSWLWFFGAIGGAILFLACINFVNLSTAQALTRAKEVGVRKVIGAGRKQLIGQFVKEAFVLIAISSILAILLITFFVPRINHLLGISLTMSSFFSIGTIGTLLACMFGLSFLTGIYPAVLSSKFQPITALKAEVKSKHSGAALLRKVLVVLQFTVSISLLIGLMLISQQMDLFFNKELGFNKDNVIVVKCPDAKENPIFRAKLEQMPNIRGVSFAGNAPGIEYNWVTIMSEKNLDDPGRKDVNVIFADEQFFDLYSILPLAGRALMASDTQYISKSLARAEQSPKIVVNEELVKTMGFASVKDAIGKKFHIGINNWEAEVVGVVPNFHNASLRHSILPILITYLPKSHRTASIKIAANSDIPATLSAIKTAWMSTFPDQLYDYQFLDQRIQRNYETESQLYGLFQFFTLLAMVISCLGLWGLATFNAVLKTKEIGIRKVLGAKVSNILAILSKEFLFLICIAIVIAAPIAWYGTNQWLQSFAYRVNIQIWVFIVAGLMALFIALLTIGFQSLRAALSHPINSLREE